MKKLTRFLVLAFALAIPAVALASDTADCCTSGHCCHPGCPFCHHR